MYFKRAKILSYDAAKRTAQVHIHGLTDGASQGLTATFAYPVGDDDRDTERQIVLGNDVYVFFEDGDESCPVIAFYSSHGTGAMVDKRRIRQKNIELLATTKAYIDAPTIHLKGNVIIDGDVTHTGNTTHNGNTSQTGNQTTTGTITGTTNVIGGGKSLATHTHGGVQNGNGSTSPPI
jgi:phage baseplate assembly protein gpV